MDAAVLEKVNVWLNGNYDAQTKAEVLDLQKNNPDELADSFYRNLEFGTGGLRGCMGVGTNRVNKYTIGMATQGFANYLKKTYGSAPIKVVVGHDSRNNSRFSLKPQPMYLLRMVSMYFFLKLYALHRNLVLPFGIWVVTEV